MRVNITPSGRSRQFLRMHGVPRALIRSTQFDLAKMLQPIELDKTLIRTKQQIDWFRTLFKETPIEPRIIVVYSADYFYLARAFGLLLFWRYLENSLNYPHEFANSAPFWHWLSLGYKDRLLEAEEKGEHSAPNLLLLDGLYDDMPATKVDKVHDILQIFCDRPVMLVLHTKDAYNYCIDRLGGRPNILFNLSRNLQRQVI